MHDTNQNTTSPTLDRTRRLPRFVLLVLLAALLVLASAFVARTELVAGRILRPAIASLAQRAGLEVRIGAIGPVGFLGVELQQLRFHLPESPDEPLLHIRRVHVWPDSASLFRGQARARLIEIDDPVVVTDLDPDSPHARWLERRRASADDLAPASPAPSTRHDLAALLPDAIVLRGGELRARNSPLPGEVSTSSLASVERVTVHAPAAGDPRWRIEGFVDVLGLGRALVRGSASRPDDLELALQALSDNDVLGAIAPGLDALSHASLSVGSVQVQWPPVVRVRNVRLRNIDLPLPDDWRIEGAWADEASVRLQHDGIHLSTSGWRVESRNLLWTTHLLAPVVTAHIDPHAGRIHLHLLLEQDDGRLAVDLQRPSDGSLRASARAEQWDLSQVAPLQPRSLPLRATEGRLTGSVHLERPPGTRTWQLDADASIEGLTAIAPRIATGPFTLAHLHLDAEGRINLHDRSFDFPTSVLTSNGLPVRWSASRDPDRVFQLALGIDPHPAQQVLEALPPALVPALRGYRFGGTTHFSLGVHLDPSNPDAPATIDGSLDASDVEVLAWGDDAPVHHLVRDDFTVHVATYEGGGRTIGPASVDWMPLRSLSETSWRAIIAAEDDAFFLHEGFDWRGIQRAFAANLAAGRVVAGGSTISQQVVKNLYLNHDRTLARKLQEAILTVLLERAVPKERILEIYLNIAHWGPGIYGLREAARGYFDHDPSELTLREACFLAAILPNPALFGEQYARRVVAPSRRQKMQNILHNLHRSGHIPPDALALHLDQVQRGVISASPPPTRLAARALPGANTATESGAPWVP